MNDLIWNILGIEATTDKSAIRRAYATSLKAGNPEDDTEKFGTLRAAYEAAMLQATIPPALIHNAPTLTTVEADLKDFRPAESSEPDPMAVYQFACQKLEVLVTTSEPVDNTAIQEAFRQICYSPVFEMAAIRLRTEAFLLHLTVNNFPRTDVLIEPLINLLKLSDRILGKDTLLSQMILQRADAMRFRAKVTRPASPHYLAYQVLMAPPPKDRLWKWLSRPLLPGKIQRFLHVVQGSYPSLLKDLNPEALAGWTSASAKPRLPPLAIWPLFVALLSLAACVWAYEFIKTPVIWMALASLVLVCFGVFLAYCGRIYGYLLPRQILRENPAWRRSGWIQSGWALAVPLLGAAASLPPVLPIFLAICLLSAVTALWAMVAGEPDRRGEHWQLRIVFSSLYLLLWWIALIRYLPLAVYLQLSAPMLAGLVGGSFGRKTLIEIGLKLKAGQKFALLCFLLGCAISAAALLWATQFQVACLSWGAFLFWLFLCGRWIIVPGGRVPRLTFRAVLNYGSGYLMFIILAAAPYLEAQTILAVILMVVPSIFICKTLYHMAFDLRILRLR